MTGGGFTAAQLAHAARYAACRVRVGCVLCGWWSASNDAGWTLHAGVVHATMLRPGHVVLSEVPVSAAPAPRRPAEASSSRGDL